MPHERILAGVIGGLAVVAALGVYAAKLHMLGFPDGHLTELERAERPLFRLFVGVSAAAGVGFLWLARLAATRAIGAKLRAGAVAYVAFAALVALVDWYLSASLDHGGGG